MVLMPHWPKSWQSKRINYDLSNIRSLLKALGSPEQALPPTIHLAGTNGKGSTNAFLRAIAEAAGLRYHSYTSPHLIEFNERIIVNGEKISDDYLFHLCERVRIAAESAGLDVSFFEATTACAFLAFAENSADLLILETGIGGRLDATNAVTNVLASIITPISYDHMNYLGESIEQIASEKAGIIKAGSTCVSSQQLPAVEQVLYSKARAVGAPFVSFGRDFAVNKNADGFRFISENLEFDLPLPSLKGDHQILNAATSIAALALGQEKFNFTKEHFINGITKASWPGRIERILPAKLQGLFTNNIELWADGAHNPHGAQVLSYWIGDYSETKIELIFGMTRGRDPAAFLRPLMPFCNSIHTVSIHSEPSSYSGVELSNLLAKEGVHSVACSHLEDAFDKLKRTSNSIIVTGSLFLVSDLYKLLNIKI